MHNPANEQINN